MLNTIKHNSTDAALVKVAQYLTKFAERGKADGIFSADFTAHIISCQKKHGLTADGVIGSATWRAIAKAAPLCTTSRNRKSRYTCALQLLLGGLNADGVYGSKTKQAVAAYQAGVGLKADGKVGTATWEALICGDIPVSMPASKGFKQPVDYKQGDSRWGSKVYSSTGNKKQTMANSGCGPTAMADVVATLKDKSVNPYTLAELSMANGHRTASGGTAWSFFPFIVEYYKFSKLIETTSLSTLKACLDAGGYVVCSMGPGYWTRGGHFICAWKYDGTYIYCNDPASKSRKKQKQSAFLQERKRLFCFYP